MRREPSARIVYLNADSSHVAVAGSSGGAGDDVVAGLGRGDAHIAESSGAEQLAGFLDLGFSTLNLMPQGPDIADQTEILATEVIPALRS